MAIKSILTFFICLNAFCTALSNTGNHFDTQSGKKIKIHPPVTIGGKPDINLKLDKSATTSDVTKESSFKANQVLSKRYKPSNTIAYGFKSITPLSPVDISTNTGEKPQSKVWFHEGKYWAVLPNSSGTHLWRLDGSAWTEVLRLSPKTTSKADCRLVGDIAHVLLFQGASSQLVSLEYSSAAGAYQLWSKRTSTVGLNFDKGVETATIDIDGNGRMWLASDGVNDIYVRWSDAPYTNWSAPITVASGVTSDDIGAIISLPGKIGVLWSNQNTRRFGFSTHADGASPGSWSSDEVPAAQSALEVGAGMADDHLNMAAASDGTLYCAVKTGYDSKGYPQVAMLVRHPNGNWDNLYQVSEKGTRPIVILNEAKGKVRVIYTSGDSGGSILYRESAISPISFSPELTLISGGKYNNPTSTKDNFTSDIVVLASSSTQAVGVLAADDQETPPAPPIAPTLSSPENESVNVSVSPSLTWNPSSGATSYQTQVSTSASFSSTVFNQSNITANSVTVNGLQNNTEYYWRVRASNSSGTSNWSSVWAFTTVDSAPPQSTIVAHWKMDEGGGSTLTDASGNGNNATITGTPTWVTGTDGLAIRFNGSSQFATVPDNPSLDITGPITLTAWIKPEKTATQYIIKKAVYGTVDGYELSLSSSGYVFFRLNQDTSGDTYRLNSTTSYPSDGATWMHVAATFDGSVIRLYINGVENTTKVLSTAQTIAANAEPLSIGAQNDGVYKFKGAIDDARIYDKALSASEIGSLATGSLMANQSKQASTYYDLNNTNKLVITPSPNPFSESTRITFSLASHSGEYAIILYDAKGAKVRELQRGSISTGEMGQVDLEGKDLTNGLYFMRLETNSGTKTIRLILNK